MLFFFLESLESVFRKLMLAGMKRHFVIHVRGSSRGGKIVKYRDAITQVNPAILPPIQKHGVVAGTNNRHTQISQILQFPHVSRMLRLVL